MVVTTPDAFWAFPDRELDVGNNLIVHQFRQKMAAVFTEWSMGEVVLYKLDFTELRHCVSQITRYTFSIRVLNWLYFLNMTN